MMELEKEKESNSESEGSGTEPELLAEAEMEEEQEEGDPQPGTSDGSPVLGERKATPPLDIPLGLRHRGHRDATEERGGSASPELLLKGAMELMDDEYTADDDEDALHTTDQDGHTPGTPNFIPHNLEELMSVPSRALDKAEEFVGELMAVPSKAYDKAEELAEGLMSVPSKAYDKAGEITEELKLVPSKAYDKASKAYDKAEEITEELMAVPSKALHKAEEYAHRVWTVVHHHHLPSWLRDNDYLVEGHRPPLNSFGGCFKSIFRIHTETGNIWTHLLGFVAFIIVSCYFLTKPSVEMEWKQKVVYSAFFFGAICCLGFSWTFHTLHCHSEKVGRIFSKLDYCGIALLEMGSFVPWMYYSFYCRQLPQIIYTAIMFILGTASIVVSMWDRFADPVFRPVRAGTFIGLGLSGGIPAAHVVITDGFWEAMNFAALGWLLLMGFLYIAGAVIYACRIPERIWPGKFDIWFQSHQIFHIFVVAAAFIHLHAISGLANYRLSFGDCENCSTEQELPETGAETATS